MLSVFLLVNYICPVIAAESDLPGQETDEDVFGMFAGNYIFMSGAGGWMSQMDIDPDGTFSGEYHDTEMGLSGDGYDYTVYFAEFTGSFGNPRKVNDYTYSFELEDIQYANAPDTEEIVSDEYGTRRTIYAEAYGLDEGTKTIYAYTASAPTDKLPDGLLSWVDMMRSDEDKISGELSHKCLYVPGPEYGWFCTMEGDISEEEGGADTAEDAE